MWSGVSVFSHVHKCYESERVNSLMLDIPYKNKSVKHFSTYEIWKQIDMIMTLYFLYVFCMQLMVFFITIKDVYDYKQGSRQKNRVRSHWLL